MNLKSKLFGFFNATFLSYGKVVSVMFLFLLLIINSPVFSQIPSVITEADRHKILIGEQIHLKINATYPENLLLVWPALPDSLGAFEILERQAVDSLIQKGVVKRSQTFVITSWDSGVQVFPPLNFYFRKKDDTALYQARSDSFLVQVDLIKTDTSKAIKEIKPIFKIPVTFREILPFIYALIGLGILAVAIFYYMRRKKKAPVFTRPKISIRPDIYALERLKALQDKQLWQKGQVKHYYIELSDITREYIENRFHLPALESTTDEIIRDISVHIYDKKMLEDIRHFLEISDLVKFAKHSPLVEENQWCYNFAGEFISKTGSQGEDLVAN